MMTVKVACCLLLLVCISVVSSTTLNVNWGTTVASASGMQYGSNDFTQVQPANAAAATTYATKINALKLPLIRVLDNSSPTHWTTNGTWDPAKILRTYTVYDQLNPRPIIVQNIPHPLTGFDSNTKVISDPAGYATFCAALVRVINIQLRKNVVYWEPMNELDDHYYWNNIDQLYAILSQVSAAMKAVDPTIKISGPALSTLFSLDSSNTFQTFKIARLLADFPSIDVISFHRYAEGNSIAYSNDAIMQITPLYKGFCQQVNNLIVSTLGRRIPIFLSEYNLGGSSAQQDMRQHEVYNVAYFASMHKYIVEGGCDWATSWNIWDQYFGLMNGSNYLVAPPAQIFTLSNTYMIGSVYNTFSDDQMVEAFAVKQSETSRNIFVINKSNTLKTVTLTNSVSYGTNGLLQTVAGGLTAVSSNIPGSPSSTYTLTVQPYNVILLHDAYAVPTPAPTSAPSKYVGCLADGNPSSYLNGTSQHDTSNTNPRCIAFCKGQNFKYAGTSYSYCFCGVSYPAANIGSDSGCAQPCNGDSSDKCGGQNYHTSVYTTGL